MLYILFIHIHISLGFLAANLFEVVFALLLMGAVIGLASIAAGGFAACRLLAAT